MNATLTYIKNGTTRSRQIDILAVKGSSTPDSVRIVAANHEYLDGSAERQVLGFNKRIAVDFGVLVDKDDRAFVSDFILGDTKCVEFSDQADDVVLESEEYATRWLQEIELGRRFTLELLGSVLYRNWGRKATETEIMYLKSNVKIEGTETNPETFTTNVGKLATDDTGKSYPVFSDVTHVFLVALNAEKNCQATFAMVKDSVAVVAGNLTFQAFVSDYGSAAADGFYYASIAIFLQVK
jgi:hypothetical protein